MSQYPVSKYDRRHDVMHVFLGSQVGSSAEEVSHGIYVNRNDNTDAIVGFTILDFKTNKELAEEMYPQFKDMLS